MPSIGARFYTQLDSAYLWGDMVEGELEKESISIIFRINFWQNFLSKFLVKIFCQTFCQNFVSKFFVHIFWQNFLSTIIAKILRQNCVNNTLSKFLVEICCQQFRSKFFVKNFVSILCKRYFRKLKMGACFVCCVSWARLTSVHILVMWQSTVKMGTSFSSGCFGLIYFDNLKRDTIGLSYHILLLLSTR